MVLYQVRISLLFLYPMENQGEIILYQPDNEVKPGVMAPSHYFACPLRTAWIALL